MYFDKDICKEGNPILRLKASEVKLPLTAKDIEVLKGLYQYLIISEVDDLVKEYDIRPGVGLAAPQVCYSKRMFAMNCVDYLDEKETKYTYALINPKIISHSEELTYLPDGEGCLSVTRDTMNLVTPRYYEITFKAYQYDFTTNKVKHITKTLRGVPAIVFQHEYDHLDGILYVDKLFNKDEINATPLYTIESEED